MSSLREVSRALGRAQPPCELWHRLQQRPHGIASDAALPDPRRPVLARRYYPFAVGAEGGVPHGAQKRTDRQRRAKRQPASCSQPQSSIPTYGACRPCRDERPANPGSLRGRSRRARALLRSAGRLATESRSRPKPKAVGRPAGRLHYRDDLVDTCRVRGEPASCRRPSRGPAGGAELVHGLPPGVVRRASKPGIA